MPSVRGNAGMLSNVSAPRILVTDAQDRAGLALIRCLNASGYRVTGSAIDRVAPGLWSRRCSSRQFLANPRHSVEAFIGQLETLLRRYPHDILIPVRDETLYAVSAHRERLEPYVDMGLPPHGVVEHALDKWRLASEARKVGLATPEGRVCRDTEQALDAARTFGFPVLVKGVRTVEEIDDRSVRYKSRLVRDEAALRDVQQRFGVCVVERRELGPVVQFGGVATDAGLLGSLLTRCHRTWPPEAGSGSFLETIAVPRNLAERIEALVRAIGWRGLFQLELIERPDGTLSAIDFNPRAYGSIGLARPAGAPLATLWCSWLLRRSPQPVTAGAGFAYRWEEGDARHIAWRSRCGNHRGAVAAAWPRSGTTHAYFEARDPLPFLGYCVELGRGLWRHTRRRR